MQNAMYGKNTAHHPGHTIPTWNMVLAASCWGMPLFSRDRKTGQSWWKDGNRRRLQKTWRFTFQQSNGTKHITKATIERFRSKHSRVLEWPSQNPEQNSAENLWAWAILQNEASRCVKFVHDTYPKKHKAVVAVKGGPTKYWLKGPNTNAHHTFQNYL